MEPDTPFYRRWSFLLAGVIGMAAVVAMLGWQGFTDAGSSPTTTVPVTTQPPPPTTAPPSNESTSKPDDVLWERVNSGESTVRSEGFRAPSVWRIEWAFDCGNFAEHGGGNFKITGNGAFQGIQIDVHDIRDRGTKPLTRGGFGHLYVETVCEQWTVRALSG